MNINEFIHKETHRLSAFQSYWEGKHKEDPELYPMYEDELDWVEALEAFIYD